MRKIRIASDYSETPLGRYPTDSKYNGTTFREEHLVPALRAEEKVVVEIDGVEGYGSSFLEEAFGGLVRKAHFKLPELQRKLEIAFQDKDFDMYCELIWKYIREAKPE